MNKILLNHFKAFKNELEINLEHKNILLYGENGSGKSSIYEALRIVFFKDKLFSQLQLSSIPDDRTQELTDFLASFNNKACSDNFQITINESDYNVFSIDNYQVFMITLEDLLLYDNCIKLENVLGRLNSRIDNILEFCSTNYEDIQNSVNQALQSFNENIIIEIEAEDDFKIRIIDTNKGLNSKSEIGKFFNEAKINLIVLLLVFSCIKIDENTSKKRLLILDDFITSLDISNRTLIVRYLLDNFEDFQKLIFTHNINFYNLAKFQINNCYTQGCDWKFANIFEIEDRHVFFFTGAYSTVDDIKKQYEQIDSENPEQREQIGTLIRKKFEILLYELSKILMIGAVEESDKILRGIISNEDIYFNYQANQLKTEKDLVKELKVTLDSENDTNLKQRLIDKIDSYGGVEISNLRNTLRELKLYQKVTMHPMSHGYIGQTPYEKKEIELSIKLLKRLETNIKKFVDSNVTTS